MKIVAYIYILIMVANTFVIHAAKPTEKSMLNKYIKLKEKMVDKGILAFVGFIEAGPYPPEYGRYLSINDARIQIAQYKSFYIKVIREHYFSSLSIDTQSVFCSKLYEKIEIITSNIISSTMVLCTSQYQKKEQIGKNKLTYIALIYIDPEMLYKSLTYEFLTDKKFDYNLKQIFIANYYKNLETIRKNMIAIKKEAIYKL